MSNALQHYYDIAMNDKGKAVVFRLTTNHPDNATIAGGTFRAHAGHGLILPSLVSDEVTWFFQDVVAGGVLSELTQQPLVLKLLVGALRPGQLFVGSLRNRNWSHEIGIMPPLTEVDHQGKGHIFYGLDANGAALSVHIHVLDVAIR